MNDVETEAAAIVAAFEKTRFNLHFAIEGGKQYIPVTAIAVVEFDSYRHVRVWVRSTIDGATIIRNRCADLEMQLANLRAGAPGPLTIARAHQSYDHRAVEAAKRMTNPFTIQPSSIVGVDMAHGPDTAIFDTMRIVNDGSKPTTHPPASGRPSPVYEEWAAANAPKQPVLAPSTFGWKPESGNWVTRAEHDEVLKNFREQNARLQEANKRDYASTNRAGRLADEAGILRAERDDLLKENARLRRAVEQLERKKMNRA